MVINYFKITVGIRLDTDDYFIPNSLITILRMLFVIGSLYRPVYFKHLNHCSEKWTIGFNRLPKEPTAQKKVKKNLF